MKPVTLRSVAWYQMRRELSRPSLWATLAALGVLTIFSVALGLREIDARHLQYTRSLQQLVQDQLRASAGFSGRQVEPALRVIRPPGAGTVIARGVEPFEPASWDFGPGGRVPASNDSAQDSEATAGEPLDLEFLVRVIGGLLAMTLSVRAIVGDRESGLASALRGFPVRAPVVALGMLLGQAAVLLGGLALVGLIACGMVLMNAPPDVSAVIRHGLLTAAPVAGAYLLLLLTLGALVGLLIRREASAYTAAFALWLVIAVLAPQLLTMATRLAVPLAPQPAMLAERDDTIADGTRSAEERLGRLVEAFATADASTVRISVDAHHADLEHAWNDDASAARTRARLIEDAWNDRLAQRRRLTHWSDWLSPGSILSSAVANAAQTGVVVQQAWDHLTLAHQGSLEQQLFDNRPRVTIRVPSGDSYELLALDRHQPPRLAELPRFTPPSPDQTSGALAAIVAAGQLLLYAAIAMSVAVWLFGRRSPSLPADR